MHPLCFLSLKNWEKNENWTGFFLFHLISTFKTRNVNFAVNFLFQLGDVRTWKKNRLFSSFFLLWLYLVFLRFSEII